MVRVVASRVLVAHIGTCIARALEDADSRVRGKAAALIPALAVGALRSHQKVHSAAAAALEKLAGWTLFGLPSDNKKKLL